MATIKDVQRVLEMTPTEFRKEWTRLSDEEKTELKRYVDESSKDE